MRTRRTGSSPRSLALLTPNQKLKIIAKERERRRLIRIEQVRQQSSQNAALVRKRVQAAKQEELEEIKKRITDAIVQRIYMAPEDAISPVNNTDSLPPCNGRSVRRRRLTHAETERAIRRHREALKRVREETERERKGRSILLERRRQARNEANARSRCAQPNV